MLATICMDTLLTGPGGPGAGVPVSATPGLGPSHEVANTETVTGIPLVSPSTRAHVENRGTVTLLMSVKGGELSVAVTRYPVTKAVADANQWMSATPFPNATCTPAGARGGGAPGKQGSRDCEGKLFPAVLPTVTVKYHGTCDFKPKRVIFTSSRELALGGRRPVDGLEACH